MSDLTAEWPTLRPAERRQIMRARILGTDRGLATRVKKMLGLAARPVPPSPRRVAARALALATVTWRAHIEMNLQDMPSESANLQRDHLLTRLKALDIAGELEPHERAFISAPFGSVDPQLVADASRRGEGLAVLAWALHQGEIPAYDQEAASPDLAQQLVEDLQRAGALLNTAALRSASEIECYATHATVVTWRLRTFRMYPGPWDLIDYLRRHASFRETWLDGLRIQDGDLAIGSQAIASAAAPIVQTCERIAVERQIAAYWLEGDERIYSRVDPATLLSAC
jgi:hypothetical protein